MSPAEVGFRLMQGGAGATVRAEVLSRIRQRWGDAAVREVQELVETGTEQQAEAWLRRSAYFLDLESMLDLGRSLPVDPLSIHGLLDLLASGKDIPMTFLFLELSWSPRDWRAAEGSVPWLADLPDAERAFKHLYAQGWLLVGCPQHEQALALWSSVRRRRGVRARQYRRTPEKEGGLTAGDTEAGAMKVK